MIHAPNPTNVSTIANVSLPWNICAPNTKPKPEMNAAVCPLHRGRTAPLENGGWDDGRTR
jgi:hypothetical protein